MRHKIPALAAAAGLILSVALLSQSPSAHAADNAIMPTTITTSTNNNAGSHLIDGLFGPGQPTWAATDGDGDKTPHVMYDLGQAFKITSVNAYWEGAYATRYVIVGWDGTQWLPLKKVSATSAGLPTTITDLEYTDQKFQYVGIAVEARFNSDWGVKMYELSFHGSDPVPSNQAVPTGSLHEYAGYPHIPAGTANLALNKSAVGSSNSKPAQNAIDGDSTTAWQATQNDSGESITIDLGGTAVISAFAGLPEAAHAKAYTIETSINGWNDWKPFATVTGASAQYTIVMPDNGPVTARYVRVTTNERALIYGTSFYEIELWGDPSTYIQAPAPHGEGQNVGQLLSYGKDVVAPHFESGYEAHNVVDNDLSTRWSTDPAQTWQNRASWDGTAWIAVDLGAKPDALNQIALRWNPAYAAGYSIFVSDAAQFPGVDDPNAWTEIYATATGKGKKEVVNLPDPSITGRWVLLNLTKEGPAGDGNFYGFSLFEIKVFGDVPRSFPINTPAPNANQDATNPDFNNLVTVWEDTFDGTAGTLPDANYWTLDPAPAGQNNAELQSYTTSTDNIFLNGDGQLVIKAIKQDDGTYTSGRLNTSRKAHVQYGRVEARAKIPAGKGLWPAFWMMGENFLSGTPWPTNGEIDVMEVLGHDTSTLHNTIHGPGYSGMGGVGGSYATEVDLSEDFHTYGVDWDRDGLRFWLDTPSNVTRSIPVSKVEEELGFPWVYDQPAFMILNLAVGGDWPGSPNADTEFPAELLVDHVRVSQSTGSGQMVTSGFDADPREVTISTDAPASLVFGETPSITITASSGRTATPSGEVEVTIKSATNPEARSAASFTSSQSLRLSKGKTSFTLPALPVGEYEIAVKFTDPTMGLFDASLTSMLTVTQQASTLTADLGDVSLVDVEPVVAVVRFTTVGSAFPTGKLTVTIGSDVTGSVVLDNSDNGVAVLRLTPRTTVGSAPVTVKYEGDENNKPAVIELTHTSKRLNTSNGSTSPGKNTPSLAEPAKPLSVKPVIEVAGISEATEDSATSTSVDEKLAATGFSFNWWMALVPTLMLGGGALYGIHLWKSQRRTS